MIGLYILTKQYIADDQCGLRGFPIRYIPDLLRIKGNRYEYEMNQMVRFQLMQAPIYTLPIETIYLDNNSRSHFSPFKDTFRIQTIIFLHAIPAIICTALLMFLMIIAIKHEMFPLIATVYLCYTAVFLLYFLLLNIIYPQICAICGNINKNALCNKCKLKLEKQAELKIEKNEDKYFNELIYFFKYEGLIRKLILDYKFNDKSYYYYTFVTFLLKNKKLFKKIQKYDTIVPVPISKNRMKTRGYNQSLLIAKGIAKKVNIKLEKDCLIKTKNIIEQSKLSKEQRITNIKNAYKLINKEKIKNKKVLLIDDIYTTGSTVNECAKTLRIGNPKKIGVLVLAKD